MELQEAGEILTKAGPVAVCTPYIGDVNPEWTKAVEIMLKPVEMYRVSTVRMVIDRARMILVDEALRVEQVKWVFFLDDDVIPIPMTLPMLLKHNLPVVSGLYFNRSFPHAPQMYTAATEPELKGRYWPIFDWEDGALLEADIVGAGCLLVRRDVLDDMRSYPKLWTPRSNSWVSGMRKLLATTSKELSHRHSWGDAVAKLDELVEVIMRRPGGRLFHWSLAGNKGEDFFFCEKLRDYGYQVIVDTAVKCIHQGEMPVGYEHWRQIRPTVHKFDPRLAVQMAPDQQQTPMIEVGRVKEEEECVSA